MRGLHEFGQIFLHKAPVDGRKQINGLAELVRSAMGHNPFKGGLFVFTTRRRDTVKMIYWNKCGFALWIYRLEEEKFRWPLKIENDVVKLTSREIAWLLEGFDLLKMKPHASLAYSAIS